MRCLLTIMVASGPIQDRGSWREALDRSSISGNSRKRVIIVGGGAAGLGAAYTLRKRGLSPILFESESRVGGRLLRDRVNGFRIDTGADFFCSSYDVTFRICEELGLALLSPSMKLGWYRRGRWSTTTPGLSPRNLIRNLPAARNLGFLAPRAVLPAAKLIRELLNQSDHLNFASGGEGLDGEESFGEYLDRLGVPESLQVTLRGFLEMTMGRAERSGQAYMRSYLVEMILKAHEIRIPEGGAGALADALEDACGDAIRVSTPVRKVVVRNGVATGVITAAGTVEADAIICAVPATRVPELIPDLPDGIRRTLGGIEYSSGCRVVIGLDRPPLPPGWHGALYPEDETPLLLDRSVNLPSIVPPGKSTLDLLVGRERAEELIPLDDEEIKRRMLDDARRNPPPDSALPADDEGLFFRVYRWKEAVCMGPPGMFTAVEQMRQEFGRSVRNLTLAGDYMRTPSVNGALAAGVGAAEEVADRLASAPDRGDTP